MYNIYYCYQLDDTKLNASFRMDRLVEIKEFMKPDQVVT